MLPGKGIHNVLVVFEKYLKDLQRLTQNEDSIDLQQRIPHPISRLSRLRAQAVFSLSQSAHTSVCCHPFVLWLTTLVLHGESKSFPTSTGCGAISVHAFLIQVREGLVTRLRMFLVSFRGYVCDRGTWGRNKKPTAERP